MQASISEAVILPENVTNNGDIDAFGTGIAVDSWGDSQTTVQYVLNNADATIEAGNDGISLMEVDGSGIINLGTITSYNGLGIYSSGSNLSDGIYNDGQIISDGPGIIAEGNSPEETVQVGIIANDENGVITAEYGPGIGALAVEGESLANTGTINAESGIMAMLSTLTDGVVNIGTINADWAGIQLDATQAVTVANQGTINVSAEYGTAINISGSELNTGVYNSGTLNAGEGILVSGYPGFQPYIAEEEGEQEPNPLSIGTVINDESGIINANADEGFGISLDFVSATGLANAGTINAGYGLYATDSILSSDIVNTGTINAEDTGISVEISQVAGNVINEGTIDARYGITLEGWEDGTVNQILNASTGEINTEHDGIAVYGYLADSIINQGKITASEGYGIYASDSDIYSGILNSGEITAAYGGIYVDSFMGAARQLPVGAVINDENGVITVTRWRHRHSAGRPAGNQHDQCRCYQRQYRHVPGKCLPGRRYHQRRHHQCQL